MQTRKSSRGSQGRYGRIPGGPSPTLPAIGARGPVQIVHAAVEDPNPLLRGRRQAAAVNAHTDALEMEYAYGRIGEASYRALRVYGAILERACGQPSSGNQWMTGDRVDASTSHELAIWHQLNSTKKALDLLAQTRGTIGALAARILALVLVERLTFAAVAQRIAGKSDRSHAGHCAWLFREAGEALADFWASPKATTPSVYG